MADIKINLLPWREELREKKKQEFIYVVVGIVVVAALMLGGIHLFYTGNITAQTARNHYIKQRIVGLEERIGEIEQLQQQRNELLSRMKVIQELQGNRPIIVRLFDELARRLSKGVFFVGIQLKGTQLSFDGVAETNTKISDQLRQFAESSWFDKPNVTEINADSSYGPQASRFSLSAVQTTPDDDDEEEEL